MRILYYFLEKYTPMYQWQRVHIIDELQRHGCEVKCVNPLAFTTPEEANESLLRTIGNESIDLFFTNVCYQKELFKSTIQRIKAKGIPTLCLRCDNLVIPYNDKKLSPSFDLVWLTSKETRYLYDKWGAKTIFAPYASNPYLFKYNEPITMEKTVVFIGTPYGSRSVMMNSLIRKNIKLDLYYKKGSVVNMSGASNNAVLRKPLQVGLFNVIAHRLLFEPGRKVLWGAFVNRVSGQEQIIESQYLRSFPSVLPSEQSSIYSKYALALASTSTNHTDILKKPLKIINLRNFEIPMSGGIEICKYNPELAEYFEDGKEIVFYKNNEELVDKARYYTQKAKDSELLSIKRAARLRAENEHTWWNRFKIAFDSLGIKY